MTGSLHAEAGILTVAFADIADAHIIHLNLPPDDGSDLVHPLFADVVLPFANVYVIAVDGFVGVAAVSVLLYKNTVA